MLEVANELEFRIEFVLTPAVVMGALMKLKLKLPFCIYLFTVPNWIELVGAIVEVVRNAVLADWRTKNPSFAVVAVERKALPRMREARVESVVLSVFT